MVGSGGIKRKGNMLNSDTDSDGSGSGSDLEKEMLMLSKKKKAVLLPSPKKQKEMSGSNSSGSDSDWASKVKNNKAKKKKTSLKKSSANFSRSMSGSDGQEDDKSDRERFQLPTSTTEVPSHKTASDLEEGEVSSSDSDDESSDSEFDDGYDENLMGDDEDKKRLNEMTEKEREQEIFKRVEAREIKKTRYEIEKKLRQQKKRELKKQKKGDGVMSKFKMDAKERSKERKKTVEGRTDKKSQAMDLLKAKREAKKEREEEKEKARIEQERRREVTVAGEDDFDMKDEVSSVVTERSTKKKLKASDIYSDDSGSDFDGGSNVKVKRERGGSSSSSDSDSEPEHSRKPVYVTSLKELNRLRLSRQRIEKWVHYPFFDTLARGMFVRLGIGHSPREQKAVYRIAEVLAVVETPKIYTLGSTRTNKGFKLRHGLDERVFRLEFVSSQEFTGEEFLKWLETIHSVSVIPPTIQDVEKKELELREAANYQFKDADVDQMILEKQRFKQSPINFAVRKTQLMKEKETAQQRGDDMRVEEIAREIGELDERAKELDKARSQSIQSISYINERNRKNNVEKAEKAIMEEIKASKGLKVEDPFTRRNTKPMPMVVNRSTPGGIPISPFTPDASFNTSMKSNADPNQTEALLFQEITTDIKNEDLLRQMDDENEDGENETVVVEEPEVLATPVALQEKAITTLIPLESLDITAGLTLGDNIDIPDGMFPKKLLSTNDLFSAHDFDIQLELDAKLPPNLPIVGRPSIPQIREPAPKRSLNLEDYKRKRGLI